jgi:hypothetical protein
MHFHPVTPWCSGFSCDADARNLAWATRDFCCHTSRPVGALVHRRAGGCPFWRRRAARSATVDQGKMPIIDSQRHGYACLICFRSRIVMRAHREAGCEQLCVPKIRFGVDAASGRRKLFSACDPSIRYSFAFNAPSFRPPDFLLQQHHSILQRFRRRRGIRARRCRRERCGLSHAPPNRNNNSPIR